MSYTLGKQVGTPHRRDDQEAGAREIRPIHNPEDQSVEHLDILNHLEFGGFGSFPESITGSLHILKAEIAGKVFNIIFDSGIDMDPTEADSERVEKVRKLIEGQEENSILILSHAHGDHIGLATQIAHHVRCVLIPEGSRAAISYAMNDIKRVSMGNMTDIKPANMRRLESALAGLRSALLPGAQKDIQPKKRLRNVTNRKHHPSKMTAMIEEQEKLQQMIEAHASSGHLERDQNGEWKVSQKATLRKKLRKQLPGLLIKHARLNDRLSGVGSAEIREDRRTERIEEFLGTIEAITGISTSELAESLNLGYSDIPIPALSQAQYKQLRSKKSKGKSLNGKEKEMEIYEVASELLALLEESVKAYLQNEMERRNKSGMFISQEDIRILHSKMRELKPRIGYDIDDAFTIRMFPNGHLIQGSSSVQISFQGDENLLGKKEFRFGYSADIGAIDENETTGVSTTFYPHVTYPDSPNDVGTIEGTYAGKYHQPIHIREQELVDAINHQIEIGGHIIAPVITLDRPYLLMRLIIELIQSQAIPKDKVEILWGTGLLESHLQAVNTGERKKAIKDYARGVSHRDEYLRLSRRGNKTIIYLVGGGFLNPSTPAMKQIDGLINAGSSAPILILGTNYCGDPGSNGSKLFSGETFDTEGGYDVTLPANFSTKRISMSGHADHDGLMRYIDRSMIPGGVIIPVHAEQNGIDVLGTGLTKRGYHPRVIERGAMNILYPPVQH